MNKKKALGILLAFTMCSGVFMFNAKAATPPAQVIQIFISGFVDSAQNAIRTGNQFFGTFVYGGLAFTGLAFNPFGQGLPGPIGDAFTNIGNGLDNAAANIAKSITGGPYGTAL